MEQPLVKHPGMHQQGQGESRGQTPMGAHSGGMRIPSRSGCREHSCIECMGGTGMCSLPDHDAYIGKEGGKGEEEEYIPSRTVNHAE